ncbi:hypothetical protein SERLADRAFT_437687 [Serpula lacrymans var. lacrymans S7.9]|uniref:Chromo domain-containing protein n=1 Tax=Serpula lacrymans var. lacrymans (strain S7.9) TaxID=578457 RepID=F8NV06_SERL9|nr:uncharacterized protein SERLADRAFT_437687 [Serpula lacrymans var. lacrymans S7.9]EGO25961.1 hypothetical protein SERLADRAFT_437687 [Serpula lacrymans var. lacrymans S7.9]
MFIPERFIKLGPAPFLVLTPTTHDSILQIFHDALNVIQTSRKKLTHLRQPLTRPEGFILHLDLWRSSDDRFKFYAPLVVTHISGTSSGGSIPRYSASVKPSKSTSSNVMGTTRARTRALMTVTIGYSVSQVREKLGLSYHNIRGLHNIVDYSIPSRAEWKLTMISFPDTPNDTHLIQYRDVLSAIRALLENPAHAKHIVYRPKKVFTNARKESRIYHEMWTEKWWHAIQARLPSGAALAPVIIAMDKTQLTQFSTSKSAYPVYLTLGNIPRAIHQSTPGEPCTQTWTEEVIHDAKVNANSFIQFQDRCKEKEVSGGVYEPFWLNFPHCNIHLSVSPNILHQLYQGVFKHMVNWCKDLMDPKELDQRISSLPACYGVRYFKNGISALGQIRGKERKDMARIFLGSQYPTHDNTTLGYLSDALDTFHKHKDILVQLNIREHLNIPKFHSLLHYCQFIIWFGTTNNYNMEMFERFHIDFAKEGWRASNKRNEAPQMVTWLLRCEKVVTFQSYLKMTMDNEEDEFPHSKLQDQRHVVAKPTKLKGIKLDYLVHWHGYPVSERTWEPDTNLTHVSDLLATFHKTHPAAPCIITASLHFCPYKNYTATSKSPMLFDWITNKFQSAASGLMRTRVL